MPHEIDPKALAKRLGLNSDQIAEWRNDFIKPTKNGRPPGKPKRPRGYLTVREVFDQYGIPAKILSQWRGEGMPFMAKHTMKLVKVDVLGKWIEMKKSTF